MRSVWDLHHQHKILPVQIVIRGQGSSRNPVLLMSGYSVLNARPRLTLRKSMISRRSLAPSPPPDDREKLRDLLCFEQEGVGTVLRCSLAVDFPLESRQHDDLRPRQASLDPLGRIEGIRAAEIDIHQDDIGLELVGNPDNLFPIGGFADHVQIRLSLQDAPEVPAESLLRICDQDPHGIPGLRRAGLRTFGTNSFAPSLHTRTDLPMNLRGRRPASQSG